MANPSRPDVREPSYFDVLIPLITLIASIGGAVYLFGLGAIDGPVQVGLLFSVMVAGVIIHKNGHSWDEINESSGRAVASIAGAIFILLAVGGLIGTWNMSGTIPTMVYYGIQLLQPSWFYLATALICAVVAVSIGSSWTTIGTIGVGLVGIASLLGISPVITAGAAISGAYLGDKTSPLSETSILSAQLVGVDIYTHIRTQIWTSIPAFLIGAVLFAILGLRENVAAVDTTSTDLAQLNQLFWITPLNLIPLVFLVFLSIRKIPAPLAILSASIVGGITGAILQPQAIQRFVGDPSLSGPVTFIKGIWMALANGYQENSGIADVDRLLSRGGMDSMLLTLWIIIGAVTFGTLMEEFGLLSKLINPLLYRAKSRGALFATIVLTGLGLNIVAGDQYIALVLPARLFRLEFQKRGLMPQNLSRLAADAGTVTSPLVPWNSCGAFMAATLGVPTWLYLPFCFFNILSPILSLLYGITGFKIQRIPPEYIEPNQPVSRL
jgi:Na+:H+ antiporter, NhaC family